MLTTNSKADHQVPQKSTNNTTFQIKQDGKFFSRLLSKESSISNQSFRVSLAIPFQWESEPGTPKHYPFSETTFPTLTPPPSYYFTPTLTTMKKKKKEKNKLSRFNLLHTLFPKLNPKRSTMNLSSSPQVSFRVVSMRKLAKRRFLSYGSSSSFDLRGGDNGDDEEEEDCGSHTSSTFMCFGIHRTNSCRRRA